MKHNSKLSPEAAKARRDYMKQWQLNNPDKVKAHQERYWQRVADRAATVSK